MASDDRPDKLPFDLDRQFTAIFVFVAVFQISLVAYARSMPYVETSAWEDVDAPSLRLIMPARVPEPPKSPEPERPVASSPPRKATAPAKASAHKDPIAPRVASKGLVGVIGAQRAKAGALRDVFDEGQVNKKLADAFSGIDGVALASDAREATRGRAAYDRVGFGDLDTDGAREVLSGDKREAAAGGEIELEPPAIDGQLSESAIAAVMKQNLAALRACYEGALKRDRHLAGKLLVEFQIELDGRLSHLDLSNSTLADPEVTSCIARRARHWRFPKPSAAPVSVSYPLIFAPTP